MRFALIFLLALGASAGEGVMDLVLEVAGTDSPYIEVDTTATAIDAQWSVSVPSNRPQTAEDTADIAALIAQLGAAERGQRRQAYAELEALGPAARRGLQQAAEHDDPEVRLSARDLLADGQPQQDVAAEDVILVNGATAPAQQLQMNLMQVGDDAPGQVMLFDNHGADNIDLAIDNVVVIDGDGWVRLEGNTAEADAAESVPDAETLEQVRELIDQLGDGERARRRAARERLATLGRAAAPALRGHLRNDDPEVRVTVRKLLQDL
jgi:hypothetical protein